MSLKKGSISKTTVDKRNLDMEIQIEIKVDIPSNLELIIWMQLVIDNQSI